MYIEPFVWLGFVGWLNGGELEEIISRNSVRLALSLCACFAACRWCEATISQTRASHAHQITSSGQVNLFIPNKDIHFHVSKTHKNWMWNKHKVWMESLKKKEREKLSALATKHCTPFHPNGAYFTITSDGCFREVLLSYSDGFRQMIHAASRARS